MLHIENEASSGEGLGDPLGVLSDRLDIQHRSNSCDKVCKMNAFAPAGL